MSATAILGLPVVAWLMGYLHGRHDATQALRGDIAELRTVLADAGYRVDDGRSGATMRGEPRRTLAAACLSRIHKPLDLVARGNA